MSTIILKFKWAKIKIYMIFLILLVTNSLVRFLRMSRCRFFTDDVKFPAEWQNRFYPKVRRLSALYSLWSGQLLFFCIASQNPDYLAEGLTLRQLNKIFSRPSRLPPRAFDFPSARTESWKFYFSYSVRALLNTLVVTSFNQEKILDFKNSLYALFLKLEVEQWRTDVILHQFTPLSFISLLPHPTLPLNKSAFTFTNIFQNTTGYRLSLPFIHIIPRNLQSHL